MTNHVDPAVAVAVPMELGTTDSCAEEREDTATGPTESSDILAITGAVDHVHLLQEAQILGIIQYPGVRAGGRG